jgi:spore germination protein KB
MNTEIITDRQRIFLVITFIIGETTMLSKGIEAGKNLWLAIILSIFMAILIFLIYARLHYNFPNKDLFDMIEISFGKVIGKGIIILFTWYIFHLTALITENMIYFINTASLAKTSMITLIILFIALCV